MKKALRKKINNQKEVHQELYFEDFLKNNMTINNRTYQKGKISKMSLGVSIIGHIYTSENNISEHSNILKNEYEYEKSNKLSHNNKSTKPFNSLEYIDNCEGSDDIHKENNKKYN
ncbi:fam-l protein [Plasmodium brasilianum]|uniref:Fam-l protein n=1 Tax=Plasmodium brasilianum TaxID=5824 RepID=A0ACB9YBG3_PLABR|nr:fam-l protein [Plasmodium brasilianum]